MRSFASLLCLSASAHALSAESLSGVDWRFFAAGGVGVPARSSVDVHNSDSEESGWAALCEIGPYFSDWWSGDPR